MSVFSSPDIIFITVSPPRERLGQGAALIAGALNGLHSLFVQAHHYTALPNPAPPRCKGLLASPASFNVLFASSFLLLPSVLSRTSAPPPPPRTQHAFLPRAFSSSDRNNIIAIRY